MKKEDVGFVWHDVPEPPFYQHDAKPPTARPEYAYVNGELGPEELAALLRPRPPRVPDSDNRWSHMGE